VKGGRGVARKHQTCACSGEDKTRGRVLNWLCSREVQKKLARKTLVLQPIIHVGLRELSMRMEGSNTWSRDRTDLLTEIDAWVSVSNLATRD